MPPHLSTAGRLLVAICREDTLLLDEIARRAGIGRRRLEECRDGIRSLELEEQLRLAAVSIAIAPKYERKAYALYGQAQAALRMQEEPGRSHQFYPRDRFP